MALYCLVIDVASILSPSMLHSICHRVSAQYYSANPAVSRCSSTTSRFYSDETFRHASRNTFQPELQSAKVSCTGIHTHVYRRSLTPCLAGYAVNVVQTRASRFPLRAVQRVRFRPLCQSALVVLPKARSVQTFHWYR